MTRLPALTCLIALHCTLALAQPAPMTREQLERRLDSTATLLRQSSGARQIEASNNPDARLQRDKALALHARAREALAEGDLAQSQRLVDAAAKTMMEAVRMAAPEQLTDRKDRSDFDARLDATRALLEAQKRIAGEKGAGPRNGELVQRIEALMAEARRQADTGHVTEARRTLDQAYGAARAAIGGMREGDTLVRTLKFNNKEEEFAYEVDRNDTHRMLVQVLLQDKRSAAGDAAVARALQESARLRRLADEQAARRDHEAGVRTLEESTRELVRAIRGAGVYIPG